MADTISDNGLQANVASTHHCKYKYKYKYKYLVSKYKYRKFVLEYNSSTSTSTKYYISAERVRPRVSGFNEPRFNTQGRHRRPNRDCW
jgi:hypothetical protein